MSIPPKSIGDKLHDDVKVSIDHFGKRINRKSTEKMLFIFYIVLFSPIWGGMLLIRTYWIQEDWVFNTFALTSIILFIASWCQSKVTADFMIDEEMSFLLAFKATIYSNLMKLSFIPIIGPVFELLLSSDNKK